jgi:hypothetical protein
VRARAHSLLVAAVALAARLAVVAWAAPRIRAIDDGAFYLRIAERLAAGLGYTWVWPDGAVSYSAFYPVGYPALAAAVYTLTGPRPGAVMVLNALLGTLGAVAAHRLAVRAAAAHAEELPGGVSPARLALGAGLLVALHPALVFYTPVVMTDGVVAALVTCAAAVAAWARDQRGARAAGAGVALGLVVGVATLVRPQSLLFAPVLGLLAGLGGEGEVAGARRAGARVAAPAGARVAAPAGARVAALAGARVAAMVGVVTLAALLVCAPWTARNCARMGRCALVSVNGGWNLIVGTAGAAPFHMPEACREVFGEAEKDACLSREARRIILAHPLDWLALAPAKLAGTFDYTGAAPWYLHESNPVAFPRAAKLALGAAETLVERLALLGALVWAARAPVPAESRGRRGARRLVTQVGALFALTLHAWIGYAALVVAALLRGRALWRGPVLGGAAVLVVAATMGTHAVFFGLGRYSMVVFPLLTALAPLALARGGRGAAGPRG